MSLALRTLLAGSLLVTASACDERPKVAPPEPAPSAVSSQLPPGLDASVLGEPLDPPAPAGDLKADLDHFVSVDACVAERAKLDPLVGDALGAIGYETFLRDACRLLEAAKDRKRETCDRIDSSALRTRCHIWVAMAGQLPEACPMQFEGVVTRGRNPSCIAIAEKDPRLCAGEARAVGRATCEAMVLRDPAKCEALLPNQRPLCQREVARWRTVLAAPLDGLEKLPVARGKLVIHGANGTPDPPTVETDLTSDFSHGVVVVTSRSRLRVELGTVVESEAARIAAPPVKRPRVGVAVLVDPQSKPTTQKLEVELPGDAPIVSPPASCDCKVTARVSDKRGGEAAIAIEGTISSAGRSFKVSIDILTFVRDVVADLPSARVLPPIHPNLRDGG